MLPRIALYHKFLKQAKMSRRRRFNQCNKAYYPNMTGV